MDKRLRDRIITFTAFLDGDKEYGLAKVTMPDFEYMTDTINGGGLAGELEVPAVGLLKSMKATIEWRTIYESSAKLARQKSQHIEFRGAFQTENSETGDPEIIPVSLQMTGWVVKSTIGSMENNKGTGATTEISLSAAKLEIDGVTQYEFDIMNTVFIVDGVDYWKDIREILN